MKDKALLRRFAGEVDLIVRLRKLTEREVVERVIGWMDYEFHGVVEDQLELLPDESEART